MKILTISKTYFFATLILGIFLMFSYNAPQEMSTQAAVNNVGGCCCQLGLSYDSTKCKGALCWTKCDKCISSSSEPHLCVSGTKKCTSDYCEGECIPKTCKKLQYC
jgi:hypothetical protein